MRPRRRAAFLTIGQSPRPDILGEMRRHWGDALEVVERGALDGLSDREIEGLAPKGLEPRLVSRLRDGREVVLEASWVETRVATMAREIGESVDFLVLLCTGHFPSIDTGVPCLRAQAVVDHALGAFADSGCRIGVLVPLREQAQRLELPVLEGRGTTVTHASPYSGDRLELEEAARSLASCEVIGLHCMGYTQTHRKTVEKAAGRPTLLARELVATAVSWLARESS